MLLPQRESSHTCRLIDDFAVCANDGKGASQSEFLRDQTLLIPVGETVT
jgi:hypothetical protein